MSKHNCRSKTRLYQTYYAIIYRCYSPNCPDYQYYGGRGIGVCQEWRNSYDAFADWSFANGYDPLLPGKLKSIDRIDTNKDYSPENCRWITMAEQNANRRCVAKLTFNGETHTFQEWAKITGIDATTLYQRYHTFNWPVENVLTTDVEKTYTASDGQQYTLRQIADAAHISINLAWQRLNRLGWSVERTISQGARKCGTVYTDASGKTYTLQELANITGVKTHTLWMRLQKLGWSVDECLAGHRFHNLTDQESA